MYQNYLKSKVNAIYFVQLLVVNSKTENITLQYLQ